MFVETRNSVESIEEIRSDLLPEIEILTNKTRSPEIKDVEFQVTSDAIKFEENVKSEQISVMEADTKELQDSGSTKKSIKISEDNLDKLATESSKGSLNDEPREILRGRFGYSVLQRAVSKDQSQESKYGDDNLEQNVQDSAKPQEKVSKYQKLLNEPLEIEDSVGKFEMEAEGFRNYVLNQIESADKIRWFESKYIRKIVTDLGGDVLKKFIDKLRQLKQQEKRTGKSNDCLRRERMILDGEKENK